MEEFFYFFLRSVLAGVFKSNWLDPVVSFGVYRRDGRSYQHEELKRSLDAMDSLASCCYVASLWKLSVEMMGNISTERAE